MKDPLSGKMKQVDRPKEEWVVHERPDESASFPRKSALAVRGTRMIRGTGDGFDAVFPPLPPSPFDRTKRKNRRRHRLTHLRYDTR